MTAARTIAITGATGLLGSALCERFARAGWNVRALARAAPAPPGAHHFFRCDLPGDIDRAGLAGADVVIHAAYSTRGESANQATRVNEEGTRRLLALARDVGVPRFIFVSSTSAHEQAASYYGRSKLALERTLDPARGDLAIRPGLILAPPPRGGLFGRLVEQVRRARFLPAFDGGRQPLQTIHIDDAAAGFERAVERGLTGVLTIAEPTPVTMRAFIALLAAALGRRAVIVPVPLGPVLAGVRVLERLGLRPPISSENLLGLRSMRAVDCRADLERLGLRVRPARESLAQALGPGAVC